MNCQIGLISLSKYERIFKLESLETVVNISNLLVTCSSDFTYSNNGDEAEEAVFSFPMSGTCTVYKFEAVVNGKVIKGVCKEKEEAKNMYESAKEKGLEAAICTRSLNQHDTFNLKVGNVEANSEVKIHIGFVLELTKSLLKADDPKYDRFNLDLPLILKPRYSPANEYTGEERYSVDTPFKYKFEARIAGSYEVNKIKSPTCNLEVDFTDANQTNAIVKLGPNYDCQKDLEIYIDYLICKSSPAIYYEKSFKNDGDTDCGAFLKTDAAILNFQLSNLKMIEKEPSQTKKNDQKFDIVFVVDRSGSMSGELINKAKECLLIFLKSLPVNCKFQIYGFGNRFDKVFDSSRLYDEDAMKVAMRYHDNLDADFGGTEILAPLNDLYSNDVASDYARIVFILTDGCVSNQKEVCQLIRRNQLNTRVFAVGIGNGVSTSLVNEMAEAGIGQSVFVRDETGLSEKVIELLNSALNGRVASCSVEFDCPEHVKVLTIPDKFNNVLDTQFLTATCVISGLKDGEALSCRVIGEIKTDNMEIDCKFELKRPIDQEESYGAHYHLAKLQIDKLTSRYNDSDKNDEELKKSLIKLSEESAIISDFTAFVAVQESKEKGEEKFLILDQDESMAMCNTNNNNCHAKMSCGFDSSLMMRSCGFDSSVSGEGFAFKSKPKLKKMGLFGCFRKRNKPKFEKPVYVSSQQVEIEEVKPKIEQEDVVMTIIKQQKIMGNWCYDESLIKKMEIDVEKMLQLKPDDIEKDIWMTLIVYCYLNVKQQNQRGKWIMISSKTKQWICQKLNDDNRFGELEKIVVASI